LFPLIPTFCPSQQLAGRWSLVDAVDEFDANSLFPSLLPQALPLLSPKLLGLLEKEVAPEVAEEEGAAPGTSLIGS